MRTREEGLLVGCLHRVHGMAFTALTVMQNPGVMGCVDPKALTGGDFWSDSVGGDSPCPSARRLALKSRVSIHLHQRVLLRRGVKRLNSVARWDPMGSQITIRRVVCQVASSKGTC